MPIAMAPDTMLTTAAVVVLTELWEGVGDADGCGEGWEGVGGGVGFCLCEQTLLHSTEVLNAPVELPWEDGPRALCGMH